MKIVTKENIETVKSFQKHVALLSVKPIALVLSVFLLLGIILIVSDILYLGIFLIMFSILFAIIFPFSLKRANEKLNESNKNILIDKFVEIEFLEEKLSVKTYVDEELINSFVCKYSDFYKIDETNDYFYMYLAINQALCVDKKDIDDKDTNEIRGLLQSNCAKYKIFKR